MDEPQETPQEVMQETAQRTQDVVRIRVKTPDKQQILRFLRKYGFVIALIVILYFAYWIRITGFINDDGTYRWPYLRNIDSYVYLRQMDMIVQNGGTLPAHDPYVLSPYGSTASRLAILPYHYIGAWSYMAVRYFIPDLQLWEYLIYLPAILSALFAIPMYFLGKALYDRKAGLISAALIIIMPSITTRTLGGDPDNDAIVMLFSLMTLALFFYTYRTLDKKILSPHNIIFSVLTGIMLVIFSFTWAGYWYVFWLAMGVVILKILLMFILTRKPLRQRMRSVWNDEKHIITSFIVVVAAFSAIVIPLTGTGSVVSLFREPVQAVGLFGAGGMLKSEEGKEFPNVYVSVAELQAGGNVRDIVQRVGTEYFIISIFTVIYLLSSYVTCRKHLDTALIIFLWVIGTVYASIVATRFTTILTPAVVLATGILLAKIWRMVLHEDTSIFE